MEKFLRRFIYDVGDVPLNGLLLRAEQAYLSGGTDIMEFEKYNIFDVLRDDIARVRDKAVKDRELVRYCYFLSEVIREGGPGLISRFSSPCKELKDETYDLLPLFALLDHIPSMVGELRRRGVPEDIIEDTRKMFQNQVEDFVALYHRLGVRSYVSWLCQFLQCRIIRVGRFNLEMTTYREPFDILSNGSQCVAIPKQISFHRSGQILGSVGCEDAVGSFESDFAEKDGHFRGIVTENGICRPQRVQYSKSEWRTIITEGTPVISVHIPSGGSLSPDVCEADLARGKAIINECFGEYRHFFCKSWLLDTQLEELLDHRGNLCSFGQRFLRFPFKSNGKGVFEYVLLMPSDTPLDSLPEKTSLARAVKAHLCSGGHIYGSCGIIADMEG